MMIILNYEYSREKPGPMNIFHTNYLGLTQTTQNSQKGCVASLAAAGFAECTHPGWRARAEQCAKVCDLLFPSASECLRLASPRTSFLCCVRNKKHSAKKESAKVCGVCVKQNSNDERKLRVN